MITSGEARGVGRKMMKDHGRLMFGAAYAYSGLCIVISVLEMLFASNAGLSFLWILGSVFLTIPLFLGLLHIFNMVYYRRHCTLSNLFDFFRNYHVSIKVIGVSMLLGAMMTAVLVPLSVILFIPMIGGIAYGGMDMFLATFIGSILLILLVGVLLGLLMSCMFMSSYYIALRNRSITFGRLLSSTLKIGWKYLWKYFVFQLSFIGWILLTGAVLGIVLVPISLSLDPLSTGLYGIPSLPPEWGLLINVLSILLMAPLLVYIYASSSAFFNTAIDEYEQQHPGYSGYVPPHIPETPVGGFSDETLPESAPATLLQTGQDALCDVILLETGINKTYVAQILAEIADLPIAEALDRLDHLPQTVCVSMREPEAQGIVTRLTDAGATAELRRPA